MKITAIPAFDDNYIWVIQPVVDGSVIVVDPGDAQPVLDWLARENVQLASVLITHHHWDHTDGLPGLLDKYHVPVYGPVKCKNQHVTRHLQEGDVFATEGVQFAVLETPGHTLDHISFYTPGYLFCGDTLFSAGCGRMFEGTPPVFFNSLQKLAELPPNTKVYCAHEYTQANVKFAQAAEPQNQELKDYASHVAQLRQHNKITLPSTIELERKVNPFLRASSADNFGELRQWKDRF